MNKSETARTQLEAKLRHVEAQASEYLLKTEINQLNSQRRQLRAQRLAELVHDGFIGDEILVSEEQSLKQLHEQYCS